MEPVLESSSSCSETRSITHASLRPGAASYCRPELCRAERSGLHGSDTSIAPLWLTLARGGADVVLAGHDHDYERFAPVNGIRSFVVGTGGRSLYPVLARLPRSAKGDDRTYGVLRLTLRPAGYDWRFLAVGGRFVDAGTARCR